MIFDANGALLTGSGPIVGWSGGMPFNASGQYVIAQGTPVVWSNGLGMTSSGAIAAENAAVVGWSAGLPRTANGSLAIGSAPITAYANGMPVNDAGQIVCSSGVGAPITVPNVVGMTQAAAVTAITGAGLTVGTVTQQNNAATSGNVYGQSPVSGTSVSSGTAVSISVSLGPQPVVPNVVNMTQAAATTAITGVGLTVGAVTQDTHATIVTGNVISQSPIAGTSVNTGSSVALVVSMGVAPSLSSPDLVFIIIPYFGVMDSRELTYESADLVLVIPVNAGVQDSRLLTVVGQFAASSLRYSIVPLNAAMDSAKVGVFGRVFHDDFTSGNTNKWGNDVISAGVYRDRGTIVATAHDGFGPPSDGFMWRGHSDGHYAWNDPMAYSAITIDPIPHYNEYLARVRVRIPDDHYRTTGSSKKTIRIYTGGKVPAGTGDGFFLVKGSQGFNYSGGVNNQGSQNNVGDLAYGGDNPADDSLNGTAWHTVQWYVNYSKGLFRAWNDSLMIIDLHSFNFTSPVVRWEPLYLMSNFADLQDVQLGPYYTYVDFVEIFSDTGTGGTGSMYEGTAQAS